MTEEELWALFHNLWTRDVGTAGYDKEKWKWLEAAVKRLGKLDAEVAALRKKLDGWGPVDL